MHVCEGKEKLKFFFEPRSTHTKRKKIRILLKNGFVLLGLQKVVLYIVKIFK